MHQQMQMPHGRGSPHLVAPCSKMRTSPHLVAPCSKMRTMLWKTMTWTFSSEMPMQFAMSTLGQAEG
jgi:hypothetical protein